MSAIFGLIARRNAAVDPGRLNDMASALHHRGPDGISIKTSGPVAIGHCLLDVARNGIADHDGFIITFDGRIDNRKTLESALDLNRSSESDAELTLAAFRKWGKDCPGKLVGDFAFAIWDSAACTLFCARDQIGVRPFFYHDGPADFVFATELRGVLAAAPNLRDVVDDAYFADYLAGHAPPADATPYPQVKRLPPGHTCTVTATGVELRCYYRLELRDEVAHTDAPEAFATIFEEAVRCRLADDRPTGALLSGGLDSSAIVSVAAPLLRERGAPPLQTFSMVFPNIPELDERPFIDAVAALGHVAPEQLDCEHVAPFADPALVFDGQGMPSLALNLATTGQLYRMARNQGVAVLLDGHSGDEAVHYGSFRLHDLAYRGAWLRLWREVASLAQTHDLKPLPLYASLLAKQGPQRLARRWAGDFKRRLIPARPRVRGLRHLNPAFAHRGRLVERRSEPLPDKALFGREERATHHQLITSDLQSYAHESQDLAAAQAGLEMRFPFLDRRLIEFALSLPSHEKMADGETRSIVRRGLAHHLPEAVRRRTDKTNFLPHLQRGLVERGHTVVDEILSDRSGQLGTFVNMALMRKIWGSMRQGETQSGFDVQALARTVSFGLWLRTEAAAPLLRRNP